MSILERLRSLHWPGKSELELPPLPEEEPLLQEPAPKPFSAEQFTPPPEPIRPFSQPFSQQPSQAFGLQPFSQQIETAQNAGMERDLQVVIAKLDTLRAQLDNVLQRLERIEQKTGEKSEPFARKFEYR